MASFARLVQCLKEQYEVLEMVLTTTKKVVAAKNDHKRLAIVSMMDLAMAVGTDCSNPSWVVGPAV